MAAINLFSGMGRDFHTAEHTVVWITGAGCAIATSVGALAGGYAANRVSRGHMYLLSGACASVCALVMAFTPHNSTAFIVGVLVYNGVAGLVYAAFNALGYQLVGQKSPVASTQRGLYAAAMNGAIVDMTWADGQGYKHFGVRGLLMIDGLTAIVVGIPLLYFVYRELSRGRIVTREAGS